MKYIVLQVKKSDRGGKVTVSEYPIIFPDALVHLEVARHLTHYLLREYDDVDPVSAGFVRSREISADCHGESESLGLKSRHQVDSDLILNFDRLHGKKG